MGKNIILRSTDPTNPAIVASTIIDGTEEPRGDGSDYDIGADEYIAVVPTPTPPATPTPTPTPTLTPTTTPLPTPGITFTFDDSEEGWKPAGKIAPFDVPIFNYSGGALQLGADGSFNCFSY